MAHAPALAELIQQMRQTDLIARGLDVPYSPNHAGQTTTRHLDTQFAIADSLALVGSLMSTRTSAEETEAELRALQLVAQWNYDKLHGIIHNPAAQGTALYTTRHDIAEFIGPLLAGLGEEDFRVLAAVVTLHDAGKVDEAWARANLDVTGVTFIAHEHDSRVLVQNNPRLIAPFRLSQEQQGLALDLIELHSVPGQYFFGEGNLAAYQPVLERARRTGSETPLRLARLHGFIDAMSALNNRFVRPVLQSHMRLSGTLSAVYEGKSTLEGAFRAEAEEATAALSRIRDKHSLGPVSLYRLMKLTGSADAGIIDRALSSLDKSFISAYARSTAGVPTWHGTYVANAFGSGLARAAGQEEAIMGTVKVIGTAHAFHEQFGPSSYAISSVGPGLLVTDKKHEALLADIHRMHDVDSALGAAFGQTGLCMRGGRAAISIEYRA